MTNPLISFASCELTQHCFPHRLQMLPCNPHGKHVWVHKTINQWLWHLTSFTILECQVGIMRVKEYGSVEDAISFVCHHRHKRGLPSALLPLNKRQNMLKYAKCLPKTASTDELHLRAQRADWCARADGGAAAAAHRTLQKHSKPHSSWKTCHLGLLHKTKM